MVRETRYLLVGNLPETTTEDEITEYFKRFGKIQKVKLERRPEGSSDSDEKEEGAITSLTATVAFTDIKSASNAHKAEKKIGNNVLSSEYSSGFGATGSVVKRTHEPEIFPRAPPPPAPFPPRKGFEEEADGFDVYYGLTPNYSEPPYPGSPFSERGRPRERWVPGGPYPGRGAKWTPGTSRQFSDSGKDTFEKPRTASVPASSPASHTSSKRSKKKKSKSAERSRSRSSGSDSSRSSSSSSESGSHSSSKERGKSMSSRAELKDTEIEPGEREPLGILIRKLPLRSSDTSLRDGLFHEYKKYGKITAVQVAGVNETRYAIISFKQAEDAAKALDASRDKRFFGTLIQAEQHEGLEGEDGDFLTPEAQLDEHSPKATRTLFLGNLDKEISIEELKEKLEKYGEILDVDVKRQGAITAYAFIQFTDITSVVKALKDLDGTTWGSTKLKVGFGKSMATPVIWLGNLADTVHEFFLLKQFSRFGALSHTVVDREEHKGLVFFMNVESAQYALPEMRNRIWNGKKIHIDYASRDCQESFYKKMETSGQLRPGERPDARSMQKKIAENPHWEEGYDPNFKRGGFNQFGRGRGRFQRGRGFFRGRGGGPPFEGIYPPDEYAMRKRQLDEYSQGSGPYVDDDYEQALRDYGHSQRERHERASQSPPPYDDMYYERGSQSGHDYEPYDKRRFESYRSLSPGSDREMEITDELGRYKRTPSDERYYYKEKIYDEGRIRERSHSSDSERYRLPSEVIARRSRSRSPTLKRTKDLPISYRSHTPPTPTEEEGYYPSDNSPTDFDSAYRKYADYKKRPGSGSVEGDRKSSVLSNTGLRREIESKSEERSSRKRSYDQLSPKRSDSLHRLERQHSRGSRGDSLYEFDRGEKLSAKELIAKVQRLRAEVNERLGVKDSPSSSSNSDIDPSTLTESDLIKLHREKQKLLQKLTLLDDSGNLSGNDSDSRHGSSGKKARMDLKYLQKSESMTKQELKDRYKKELREYKKSKSVSDVKKDLMDYSEEDSFTVNSPRDYPPGFMPKKRRKLDSESERKRSYRSRHDDDQAGFSSDDEKDRNELVRQSSGHGDTFLKSRTLSSLDARLESAEFSSHSREESRRVSSGSDNNKEHSEHSGHSRRRHKKRENHITPLIPLGDDSMPDPETSDPRSPCEKCERPMVLPLPDFAQFIQFSPLPSPHHSPERYSDLRGEGGRDTDSAGNADTTYQSPCFSPQSSSSKTHSPSQSPNGSGSDTKANTNSDSGSGEIPLGFPTETEQIDPEANKTDSLDSVPDPSKSPEKSKHDDSFSDNNSDLENLGADNLSIEERIRQLDEKWNKAQAVAAATPKVIPDVDSMVNSSSAGSPLLTPFAAAPVLATASASPTTSSLYSKYRIRKRNDLSGSGTEKETGPSEIVQTVLSKSSIFDQDSKRLGQTDDSLKESSPASSNSPKLYGAWNKSEVKENPMVTVPGSLLDRLGQGNNGSFPTLTVNTSFPSATSVSVNRTESSNQNIYSYESRLSKLSPLPSLDIPSVNNKTNMTLSPMNKEDRLLQKADSESLINSPRVDKNGLGIDIESKRKEPEKSPVMPKSILKNRSNSDISSLDNSILKNGTDSSVSEDTVVEKDVNAENVNDENDLNLLEESDLKVNSKDSHSPKLNGDIIKTEKEEKSEVSQTEIESAKTETFEASSVNNEDKETVSVKTENSMKEKETISEPNKTLKTENMNSEEEKMEVNEVKMEQENPSVKEELASEVKVENAEIKMELDASQDSVKASSSSKSPARDKHSSKSSKDSSTKEPSHKRQKLSKDGKEKRSESSHKEDKHKKKDGEKKSDSSHKSSSEKKDDKHKEKHKSKSDKEKKDGEKKPKEEKKDKEKKKSEKKEKEKKEGEKEEKDEKADKHSKDKKDEKPEEKKPSQNKDGDSKETKEKSGEKKEKSEKKHEKKEGHKHDKHSSKSPDKKSKSSHKKEENVENKESEDKPKETVTKESTPKESTGKEAEKEKKEGDKDKQDKEKTEKKSSDSSSSTSTSGKKEHKSSSHKSKKSKDDPNSSSKNVKDESKNSKTTKNDSTESKKSKEEEKKSKEEDSKKVKDDHSEHKKKDEVSDRNNKDSPDKNKDVNRKEFADKKSSEKTKDKSNGSDKCKDDSSKNKEKENKDKDPDHNKSKGSGNSNPSTSSEPCEKPKTQSTDAAKTEKSKAENDKDEKNSESKKEEKSKDAEVSKTSNSVTKKSSKDTDNHKKSTQKNEKSGKNKEDKKDLKLKDKSDSDNKSKKESKRKEPPVVYNGLTEEDLAIFAKFADESSLSMYAKVKRRSTEKKLHHDKELEEQNKLLTEYKKNQHVKSSKKVSLSDITESSEVSSDEDQKKSTPKNRKKFAFSSDDSDSSTDTGADILEKKNKAKMQAKKPKRILDIYSSDSEEEEMNVKKPSKTSSTKKKKAEVHRENDNKFDFDSTVSDSDNKTSATQQAKAKTKTKPEKKQSKSKSESKSQPKSEKKDDQKTKKPKLQRKDFNFKDLFSDDSDDSMLSDSDSDSDIMMTSKAKKKTPPLAKNDKNKKTLPRGSSIYTSSEDSDSDDDEFKPMSPPKTALLPKKTDKKVNNIFKSPSRKDESDSMTSDTDLKNEKNKVSKHSVHNSFENSMDSDSFVSEPEIHKSSKMKAITEKDRSLKKLQAEKSREQIEKDLLKLNNKKFNDIITDDPYSGLTKMEISKVYSETVYEKDTLLTNLSNKDNLPPVLTDINKEPLLKLDVDSVRNDIPTLKDIQIDDKSGKVKNKKHKRENKKKKKSKEKGSKDSQRDTDDDSNKHSDTKQEMRPQKSSSSENLMQDSDLENMNAVNRNLFDDMKGMKSPEGKRSKNKGDSKSVSKGERLTDSDMTDSEKKKVPKSEKVTDSTKAPADKTSGKSDVFDFKEEENKVKPFKESHMKITKPEVKEESDHEGDNASNVPVEIQDVEIEYRTDEQDYKDEGFNICPVVETTEVVIENASSDNEKDKAKPRKRKGRKNSGKDTPSSLTEEAVSSLSKEGKVENNLMNTNLSTNIVQFEDPVSNENELIIDEGASLHVEDETEKAVESIVNDETDETAKAVESILLEGMPAYTISEPVEPTPTLDQNYLQPEFAPGLPNTVPQVGTEVETATTNSPLKGKKGRKGRRTKSGQGDSLLSENSSIKPFDLLGDSSLASDLSTSLDQNDDDDDDDDDDGKLQIDFDPPKPEAKQKKPRKPKQTKGNKMNDVAALAAESKLDSLFPNFGEEKKDELNRDSLSSENSELERSKNEDLLFISREDQRHDSDLMSPDERSTSDDLTSPDLTKPKPKRGRKPKNKDQVTTTVLKTNSPRTNSRTLSPRSPRNTFDPKSPEPKMNGPKNLIIDEGSKQGTNVFDFDENDESNSNISSTPSVTGGKQRKPRQKKKGEPGLQSPESRSMFSSPENDKLVIGSPEPKGMFSPEHKGQVNIWDKKPLFSPNLQPEDHKLEVKTVSEDKPPEPLFKAFFEAKKDSEKVNPLLARKGVTSPKDGDSKQTANAKIMSNVDKTIEDVSKGLFESTDDEGASHSSEQTGQKKRQVRKSKEEDMKSPLRSPVPKSPALKSPLPKSPLKSPMSHMTSPPHQQPLVLPGMGIGQSTIPAQIGEPQVAGPVSMFGQISSPSSAVTLSEVSRNQSMAQSVVINTSALSSPNKSMGINTLAQTSSATSVIASNVSVVQDLRKVDGATESIVKSSIPGFLVPGISASAAASVLQGIPGAASTTATSVVTSSVTDSIKRPPPSPHMDKLASEQQQRQQQQQQVIEQQKLLDQKQAELQRQQEHHVKLKEMELKKQMEQQRLLEEHKKLQEQMMNKEIQDQLKTQEQLKSREEMLKKEQEKKRLEEQYKFLQDQHERLQKQQALQAAGMGLVPASQPGQQELLSPGALQRQRPGLSSPSAEKGAPRPPVSAHHTMSPGGPFGLVIRPGQFPPHLTAAQIQAMQHLVQPLGSDKPPTSAEMVLKHQQLQQQMAQAQKALAEQQAQLVKQQPPQAKQGSQQSAQGKAGKGAATGKKGLDVQPTSQGVGMPSVPGKDGAPLPGSQEAANQLTAQIKQQLAMQAAQQAQAGHQGHPGSHGVPPQGPQGVGSWPHRPDGPRQPGPPQGPIPVEARTSIPGSVPMIGGNPQQVQRVSPNPPNKSPTVAQTAPNMVLGFSQHQTAAPRAPSPAVAKTAVVFPQTSERQVPSMKWPARTVTPRTGQPDVRPRPPSSEAIPPSSRPDLAWGVNGPSGIGLNATPRPAHQQQPDTLQLKRVLGAPDQPGSDKFMQQQHEKHIQELHRQEFLKHQQELQRQHQLRDQALHAQAQKEVQIHKEREEREKREAQANHTPQGQTDPRQSPALRMSYPFVEPRPPSQDSKMQQSPAIVDPRDPRFTQQFPGHHPADLRMGSSQASAFSPAAGNSADPSHMYSQAELQRLNGLIPAYPPSLIMRDPHLIPGHAPYMLPGHLAYMAQQMEHQHLVDGRPPSRGTSRPPSNQPVHNVSPTQQAPGDSRNQNRGPGQTMGPPTRDPHPGDGSLLSLLQRYPVMWQGVLGLKNDQCVVQMHFISGFQPLVKMSLPQQAPDGTVQPLRIAQRMRLEQAQLEGVAKRMQMEKDYCMMLALPCGRDHTDIYQQTRAMSTGFIQYLQQKQAAGIVNVADPGSQQPAYVVHIFPPCDFSQNTLSRLGFDLLYQVKDLAHLIVIIATVA